MRTSARRKLDLFLIAGGALVAGGAGAVGGLLGQGEEIRQLWARAELLDDGAAEVTEVVDYDFGVSTDRHGIFRVVPGLDPGAPVDVASPDAPADVVVTSEGDGARIRIGDPNTTVSGEHRYLIGFELGDIASGGVLAWDAVGTEWEVPVARAEIHVVADRRFDDAVCQEGTAGSTDECEIDQPELGHLLAVVTGIDPGEGVTVRATLGERLSSAPEVSLPPPLDARDETTPALAFVGGGGAALAAGLVGARLVRRAGREQVWPGGATDAAFGPAGGPFPDGTGVQPLRVDITDLQEMTTIEFAPPRELHPAEGGVLLTEDVRNEHKVAWLIDAAGSGLVDLEGDDTLVRRPIQAGADPETVSIVEEAFAGRDRVELGRYDPSFARAWGRVGDRLERWRHGSGLWDAGSDQRSAILRVVGFVGAALALVGVLGTAWLAADVSQAWLIGTVLCGAVAGVCVAAAVRGWELRVRTPQGTALWLRVESFRRFLAESEAYHAEEAAKRGVLREYTAWAVATGEIDRWSKAVAAAAIAPATASSSGLAWAYVGSSLVHSTTSTSTAPSSSGGGGGFSGGVGGGGGGGGGGSW